MNAAMQSILALVAGTGRTAEGKSGDGRHGETFDNPFALLLDEGQQRGEASRPNSEPASAIELAQAFLLAQREFDKPGALEEALAELLNGTKNIDDDAAAPDSPKNSAEGEQISVDAALMQALAALLDNDEAPPSSPAGDMEDGATPTQGEDDGLKISPDIPPMPYPYQSQTGDAGQAGRRANIDVVAPRDGAVLYGQAKAPEGSRDLSGRLQQPAALQELAGARPDADRLATTRSMPGTQAVDRVQVISQQSSAAPLLIPQMPLSPTGQSVVQAIEAANPMRPVQADMANMISQRIIHSGTTSLKIQLQPADLGMVTARLTATGTQLSVELQVETSDARHRLSGESEAITKAMRAIGYDVERVTVQQSSPPPNQQAGGQQNAAGREFAGSQQQPESDDNGRGGRRGHAQGNAPGQNGNEPAQNHTDGSVYI